MFNRIYVSIIQFFETYRSIGFVPTIREIIYINRELIILEKDLSSVKPMMKSLSELNLKFIEISKSNFKEFKLKYPFKSRHLKTVNNLNKGYRSFAVIRGNEVIGDLWYTTKLNLEKSSLHHDLEWLGIDLEEKDVYGWDNYIKKEERKNSAAMYLMSQVLYRLREKGFNRIYGFVFVDNTPASFLYQIFGFKELKRMKANRFLFFRRTKN